MFLCDELAEAGTELLAGTGAPLGGNDAGIAMHEMELEELGLETGCLG